MKFRTRPEVHAITKRKDRSFYWDMKERLMESGVAHDITTDDFYLLPLHAYHIGISEEFRVDLCIVITNMNRSTLVQESLYRHAKVVTEKLKPAALNHSFTATTTDFEREVAATAGGDGGEVSVQYLLHDNDLRLRSNSGVKHSPILRDPVDLTGRTIELATPLPIVYDISGDDMNTYVRGRVIRLFHDELPVRLIDRLNAGENIPYGDCISFLARSIDEEEAAELLAMIYHYCGIRTIAATND